jgi:hypothetical protein
MISLEGAVKNISKTYAGMTGELGELLPQLKSLTVEQLKAGAAVDVIKKGYAGMAEAAASGVAGSMEIFKNNFNSLKESIGGILGTLASYVQDGRWSSSNVQLCIVTGDTDLFQLISEKVSVMLPQGNFRNLKEFLSRILCSDRFFRCFHFQKTV